MLIQNRQELCRKIENSCIANMKKKNSEIQILCDTIYERHNMPKDKIMDVLSLREKTQDQTDFMIFIIAESLFGNSFEWKKYYTEEEYKRYSMEKFKIKKIEKLQFPMIEISDDHYIGMLSTKQLIELRDNQLLRYNEETQRIMKVIINGETEIRQISHNRSAINDIKNSVLNGTFIGNTLTFNVPEDASMSYENGILTISNFGKLDIVDGYHRYVGISNAYNENPNIDCPMELRIICFNLSKAKRFIWQEDQKTHMKKVVSNTFNSYSPVAKIIEYVNDNSCMEPGFIKSHGLIDNSVLMLAIDMVYFRQYKIKPDNKDVANIRKDIVYKLDEVFSHDNPLFNNQWTGALIISFVVCCKNCSINDVYEKTILLYNETKDLFTKVKAFNYGEGHVRKVVKVAKEVI